MIGIAVLVAWLGTGDFIQTAILRLRSTPDLERAVRENPQSPWPVYMLGVRYARGGRLPEAITLFERARQAAPDSFDVRYALGKAYVLTGNGQAAVTELIKAAQLAPNNAQVVRYLGMAQRVSGDLTAAKDSEKRATTLDPSDADAWYQYGVAFPAGASNEADGRPLLRKAVELKPENAVYNYAYGQSLADGAQFAEAIPFLRKAVGALPDNANGHFLLGLSLHRAGNAGSELDEATAELKRAIKIAPGDFRTHFELGNILLEQGKYALALPEFELASRLGPRRLEVWSALRDAAARTGHPEIATRARAHFDSLRKDHSEMETLQHRLVQRPDDPPAQIRLAQLLEKQGNMRSAALYYSAVLERDPSNAQAHALLERLRQRVDAARRREGGPLEGPGK